MKKAAELSKHTATVNNLKRKLAKQIVNNTLKIKEFKQLTLEDLFKHTNVIEQEKQERKKNLLSVLNNPDLKERDRLMDKKWQKEVDRNIQSQVATYSSNFEIDKDISEEKAEIQRMRTKIENPYAYFQERQNRIFKAFELMAVYKTVYQIEKEINDA